jgi:hypothetical protein
VLGLRRRGKAVLLATNQLQFLTSADKVCYMENGRIAAQGAPQDASLRECPGFQQLLADYEATATETTAAAAARPPPADDAAPDSRRQRADALLSSATAGTMLPRGGSEGAASASPAAAASAPPQPASPSSSSSSSRLLRRVPTFAIEQEARLEALHDAAGGTRGLNRADGVPPLESAFARESGPRPGQRGDGGGGDDDDDGAASDGGASAGGGGDTDGASASSSSSSSRRRSFSELPSPRRDNSLGAGFLDLVTGTRRGASLDTGGTLASRAAAAAASRQNSQSLRRNSSGSRPAMPNPAADAAAAAAAAAGSAAATAARASKDAEDAAAATDAAAPEAAREAARAGELVRAEDQEEGAVGSAVYSFYIARYGRAAFTALILLWASEQAARVLTNWWLSRWTGAEALAAAAAASPGAAAVDVRRTLRLGGYLGLSLAFVLFSCLRSATNLLSAARASKAVHGAALGALARSPVSFFDRTPVGRSLNRFSRDMDDVDYLLPQSLNDAGNCVAQLASALVFIAIVQPFFLAGLAPILLFYYLLTVRLRVTFFCPFFFLSLALRFLPASSLPLASSIPRLLLLHKQTKKKHETENLPRLVRRAPAQRRRLSLARLRPLLRVALRGRHHPRLRPRGELSGAV